MVGRASGEPLLLSRRRKSIKTRLTGGSMEQKPACEHRCDRTDNICAKAGRNRMARLRDTHRAKINSNDVKRCFRAAIDRRCRVTQNIVRSELLDQVSQYSGRTAAA